MERALLQALNAERRSRRAVILATNLGSGEARLICENDALPSDLAEAAAESFRSGKSRQVELAEEALFLNVYLPAPRLVVIGAVHISQALAPMARLAGFDVEIIDPRTAFATPERFLGSRLYAEWPEAILAEHPLDRYCAVAALTHDPKIDDHPLQAALSAGCFYVGALGSRKTHAKRLERLAASGASTDALGQIRAPIGLDIGAAGPAEIAVAILGEVIAALRKRAASSPAA
jgi:xanthine dehydrogenase accessory factor